MAWVKLDDAFFINRKVRSAGPQGQLLYLAGLCWCAMQLNDGHINAEDLPAIAGLAAVTPDIADRLVAVGLWARTDTGYHVPDYLEVNKSRSEVLAEREAGAERQRRSREKSRRDSHRDTERSNGVSAGDPSRPVPNSSHSTRRPGDSRADAARPDDDEISTVVPAETWTHYATLKLSTKTDVRDPVPWKATCARNARTELGPQAADWWHRYDFDHNGGAYRLAQALVAGEAPRIPRRNGDT